MSTKSYSLADGTTVTVNATDNGIKFNEGMNILTKAIKAKIANSTKPTPNLSLGGWSIADTVYTAPITYDGDGELSVNVGSISNGSLIVNDADGIFNGVLTASAGDSYAQTNLAFTYNTDYVTIQGGGDISDTQLQKILEGTDYGVKWNYFDDSETFLFGQATVQLEYLNSDNYLTSSANSSITLGANTSKLTFYPRMLKLSETTGLVYRRRECINGSYTYQGVCDLLPFNLDSNGNISTGTNITVAIACNSVASINQTKDIDFLVPPLNKHGLIFSIHPHAATTTQKASCQVKDFNPEFGNMIWTTGLEVATINPSSAGKTDFKQFLFPLSYRPVIQFDGQDVTISKGSSGKRTPFLCYSIRKWDSTDSTTLAGGGDYALFCSGNNNSLTTAHIYQFYDGTNNVQNDWFTNDDYVILGVFPNKANTFSYVVTYKAGNYSKVSYLDDAFKVWRVDYKGAVPTLLPEKLTDVLDDLAI